MHQLLFVLTIDVEPDCSPTWHYSNPLTFKGVSIGIKDHLQPLFNKYGIVPTYLINNVVLEDAESVNIFRNVEGEFELGTHLHPEFIEPEKSVYNYAGSKGEANCCFYHPDVEFRKIKNITELFEKNFGYKPQSFRAGRFSAGENTFKSLTDLGYKIDTSVTPHINWNDSTRENDVDYTNMSEQPYWINDKLLEVPISIIKTNHISYKKLMKSCLGLRYPFSKTQTIWLRPIYSDLKNMEYLINSMKNKFCEKKCIVFNMMFHNVEIIPNLSPYTRSQFDHNNYLNLLTNFFKYCTKNSIVFVSLSELANIIKHDQ